MQSLPVPAAVLRDPDHVELARIWAANGRQYTTLDASVWSDPTAWGVMLVDFAKHVAAAYERDQGMNSREVLDRIRAGFDAEWSSPTDAPAAGEEPPEKLPDERR